MENVRQSTNSFPRTSHTGCSRNCGVMGGASVPVRTVLIAPQRARKPAQVNVWHDLSFTDSKRWTQNRIRKNPLYSYGPASRSGPCPSAGDARRHATRGDWEGHWPTSPPSRRTRPRGPPRFSTTHPHLSRFFHLHFPFIQRLPISET